MSDSLGNVIIPTIAPSGTFPIVSDYGYGYAVKPDVAVHQFGSANTKIEQRFLLGNGAKRFSVRRARMRESDRIALRDFWEQNHGGYGAFTYNAPNADGNGTTAYTCRFENAALSWQMLTDFLSTVGITLIEIPNNPPTYTLNATDTRFPDGTLTPALLAQVQQMIPLVHIVPTKSGYPNNIFLSDRRCTIGGQLYLARLVNFSGISQVIGNEADNAEFTFGNADRAMTALVNDVDLFKADIELSLFHVGTGIKIDLWKGEIIDWQSDYSSSFKVAAQDGLYELNLPYPTRRVNRQCWKVFNDGQNCPFAGEHTGAIDPATGATITPDGTKCDKSYDAPNGCLAHGMKHRFGGILAEPQAVRVLDNSSGTWGFGRSAITSVSLVAETLYDEVVPEVYTDILMPVNAKIAAGRDEGDYYEAMGIVSEGPVSLWVPTGARAYDSFGNLIGSQLDGQFNHGFPNALGFRGYGGTDPAGSTDFLSLDQGAPVPGSIANSNANDPAWRLVASGASIYKDTFAAGTAFEVIRRKDAKGLQLSTPGQHQMQVMVQTGMGGWTWTAPGSRTWSTFITNQIWISANALMRSRGYRSGQNLTSTQLDACEQLFDVNAAVAAATICNLSVTPLIYDINGDLTETQFQFRGVLMEEKPLRQWLQEILMNCVGYYTFEFGKLKFGIRENASVVETFTVGNILLGSLVLTPMKPSFNHITANFADNEFLFANNSIQLYDEDNATLIGSAIAPQYRKANLNLSGTSTKSQAGRIITTRLREELGGINASEWAAARRMSYKTTVLALNTEPGMVCSMTHADMPAGIGKFRVEQWRLNSDYSIEISGKTVTASMYDLTIGPKPADAVASKVPSEPTTDIPTPTDTAFSATPAGPLQVSFTIPDAANYASASIALLVDEDQGHLETTITGDVVADADSITLASVAGLKVGEPIRIGTEILIITGPGVVGASPASATVTVNHNAFSTQAAFHAGGARVVRLTTKILGWSFLAGFTLANAGQPYSTLLPPGKVRIYDAALTFTGANGNKSIPADVPLLMEASNVTGLSVSQQAVDIDGNLKDEVTASWVNPADMANFGGVQLYRKGYLGHDWEKWAKVLIPNLTGLDVVFIHTPGSGYEPDDVIPVPGGSGGTVRIVTTLPGGVPNQVAVDAPGQFYSDTSNVATSGGTGSGLTIDIIIRQLALDLVPTSYSEVLQRSQDTLYVAAVPFNMFDAEQPHAGSPGQDLSVFLVLNAGASAPAPVSGLQMIQVGDAVSLIFNENTEPDIDHYEIAKKVSAATVQGDIHDSDVIASVAAAGDVATRTQHWDDKAGSAVGSGNPLFYYVRAVKITTDATGTKALASLWSPNPPATLAMTADTAPPVTAVSVSESPNVAADGTVVSRLSFAFTKPSPLLQWKKVIIYAVGYQNSSQPVLITDGTDSPIKIDLTPTNESVAFYFVSQTLHGLTAVILGSPSAVVLLDGQDTAPNPPSGLSAQNPVTNTSIAANSVIVSWTPGGETDLDHYQLAFNTDGHTPLSTDPTIQIAISTLAEDPLRKDQFILNSAPAGVLHIYLRAVNSSGLISGWSTCTVSALAPDQTTDITVPDIATLGAGSRLIVTVNVGAHAFPLDGTFHILNPGTAAATAIAHNMKGIFSYEIETTWWTVAVGGSDSLSVFTVSEAWRDPSVSFALRMAIELPNVYIRQIRIRAQNYFGWSPWWTQQTFGTNLTAEYTGSKAQDTKAPGDDFFDPTVQSYGASSVIGRGSGDLNLSTNSFSAKVRSLRAVTAPQLQINDRPLDLSNVPMRFFAQGGRPSLNLYECAIWYDLGDKISLLFYDGGHYTRMFAYLDGSPDTDVHSEITT